MSKVRNRKFAWVALVLAMALVGGPAMTQTGTVYEYPPNCPPTC